MRCFFLLFQFARRCLVVAVVCLVASPLIAQQSAPSAASQDGVIAQMQEQIRALQAEVKQLQEKQQTASEPAPAPTPQAAAVPDMPRTNEVAPRLKLNFFGDTGYESGHYYSPTNAFEFGEFDMFATARLSDRTSVLADILFTANTDNSIGVDVERLLLRYRSNDYFSASIGRIHTAIGYYNTAFHRGDYFQTPIGRPAMYEFDDQGGFLPMQDLGIALEGKIPSGKLGLNYVFEVTNGRAYGANVEPAQNAFDGNNSKAVNINISAKPERIPGLDVGFSVRHDNLSDVNNLHVSEVIPVVYVVYANSRYEWLNEAMLVSHSEPIGPVYRTPGWYTQLSRRFGPYRPYFRYSYVNASPNDPIYGNPTEIAPVGRINGPTVGMRYDFGEHAAVKAQYDREEAAGLRATNGAAAQFSFTF